MWRKLQRDMRYRWIGGVCSGIARFIGFNVFPMRMLIRFLFIAFFPTVWWIYLLLWIFLPPQKLYELDELPAQERKTAVYRPRVKVEVKRLDFDDVVVMSQGHVSERVLAKVTAIDAAVRSLMPYLTWRRTLVQPEFATVKRAALEYFPRTLQHYLSLPRDYAEQHRLVTGQTPEEKLLSDFGVLENTFNSVLESLYSNDKINVPADLKRLNERVVARETPVDDMNRTLDELVERIRGKVSEDIFKKVTNIRAAIVSVLPQIAELGAGTTQEAYNVKQTALEYLPDALDKYLSLPDGFAETTKLSNGKTAKETLLEQLELLETTMKDIVGDVYEEDAQALLIHGRFLKEKFADQKFAFPLEKDAEKIKFPDLSTVETEKVKS
ncbi:MAG: PspC domain-containing protein [Trueperaceae bacterium]|nr:MAG: PspC domain-containing protein [Trueperaceae bacterium]